MSQDRLPPPAGEECLVRVRPSSQKGGTIIAEDVRDLVTHEARLSDPDGYRPGFCPGCRATTLHVHDYRSRQLRGQPGKVETQVVRHTCVACAAIWQVLPALLARCLWRTWAVVERTLTGATPVGASGRWPPVPARTQRRWRARWLRPALFLIQVLATSGSEPVAALAMSLAPGGGCGDMIRAYAAATATAPGERLSGLAALVYRLQPSVRLM
jgi:hypothetical protein